MATYYVDFINGNDANAGTSWGTAWATLTNGATTVRTTSADEVRVAKSPAPYGLGLAQWTQANTVTLPTAISISSSTNATPIVVTTSSNHGYVTGDVVRVYNHTTNTSANGIWIIEKTSDTTFKLLDDGTGVSSAGVGIGGASGSVLLLSPRVITLSSATTKPVPDGSAARSSWTSANGSTVGSTVFNGTTSNNVKWGYNAPTITPPAVPSTGTKYAYFTFPGGAVDLSAYNALSFFFRNNVAAARAANTWTIALCSDTLGDTPIDGYKFTVPNEPAAQATWSPFTVAKGASLGASVQSIAIYSGSVAPTGGANGAVCLCNVTACTSGGLSLTSLVSKNSSEKGGTEPWYGVQGIYGKIVGLDAYPNDSLYLTGGWYWGTTENVATYARETIKLTAVSSGNMQVFNNAGVYSGGWNTSSGLQDGETFLDGINSSGSVLVNSSHTFQRSISYLSAVRAGSGLVAGTFGGHRGLTVSYFRSISAGYAGLNVSGLYDSAFSNCHSIGAPNFGFLAGSNGTNNLLFNDCVFINTGTGSSGGTNFFSLGKLRATNVIIGGGNTGLSLSNTQNALFVNCKFYAGGTAIVSQGFSTSAQLVNCLISNTTETSMVASTSGLLLSSHNHDQTPGLHKIFAAGAQATTQTATRPAAVGTEWLTTISGTATDVYSPFRLPIAKIACAANKLVTVKLWFKKSHATNIAASLVCPGGQIAGIATDVSTAAPSDTNWNQVTLTFTPTENGVVQLEAWMWYVAATGTIIVDDISVS